MILVVPVLLFGGCGTVRALMEVAAVGGGAAAAGVLKILGKKLVERELWLATGCWKMVVPGKA